MAGRIFFLVRLVFECRGFDPTRNLFLHPFCSGAKNHVESLRAVLLIFDHHVEFKI